MKYKDMDQTQKEAYKDILLHMINIKSQEEQEYSRQYLRFLTLGNGSGILLLSAFMGSMAENSTLIATLVDPLIKFSIGAILSALMYFPFMVVSNQATISITNQVDLFFRNEMNIEDIQGYGFSKLGILIVWLLKISSFLALIWGLYESIHILKALK